MFLREPHHQMSQVELERLRDDLRDSIARVHEMLVVTEGFLLTAIAHVQESPLATRHVPVEEPSAR
jgi:hypothetical protein